MMGRWIDWLRGQPGNKQVILYSGGGMLAFLLWASLAPVDEVTHGQGRVIPSSKAQVIQSAEPTTIEEILVRSGQKVSKGQLLVRLDDAMLASELGQLQAETRSLAARAGRLEKEGTGAGENCTTGGPECQQEQALAAVRQSALRSKQDGLSAQVEQRRRELGEAQATIDSLGGSVQLARQRVAMLEPLAAKSIIPQTELLDARRDLVDAQGRLNAAQQQASRASAAIREAQAQLSEANYQFRQDALNERSQLEAKIAVNSESLRGAKGRAQRAEIRSPVDGVVNDVQVTTIGGFVTAGQKIMQIVPIGDKLLVETRVKPNDIAFIKTGDRAVVKVTAYDFSIYGGLSGTVQQVSADSVYDEATREAYFTVVVETDRAWLGSGAHKLPITPGMVCDVEILTGRKSVLAYLLKPIMKARAEALRER
ncbi:HlyD family type I secretion periplasmic adaptor subunit [Sphingomonadales bacterium 56]|jgi:membrane fusion protein, adhesin transport system|uniref:Membrane fusion protein (MFP) family protein n=1 Tax=Sphingobium agri TaxID=2933566 RepID=A0ABT0DY03_9SPHN|nr:MULTISPECIES: HlyD family type I secretion periplasmic adaptor subunit [Sphingomonadaceae]MBY2927214.1 HlyD family type I secretion periplasmic adaptor subunit [Sphingomonadales bacterium 56]MBY2957282.1 HlyD family type I secretion periplasmic adaptor subunit [Sphingomonadales bacterium 58]MCK0532001.1 HlyD family type I secretion periplasmic adaptor subunit [Sphingobium agri]CAD7334741.1 Hemolysin secretion protein D, chromosomal [Sphingobium sp. S8]CAD7334760.1 Hemolysin secretion protei